MDKLEVYKSLFKSTLYIIAALTLRNIVLTVFEKTSFSLSYNEPPYETCDDDDDDSSHPFDLPPYEP